MKFSLASSKISFVQFKKFGKVGVMILILGVISSVTIVGGKAVSGLFARASSCSAKNVGAVQVGANSAVISWSSDQSSQGRVEYGVDDSSLSFTTSEGSAETTHNVPLTLLTPNTVYYYQLVFGTSSSGGTKEYRCDSSGGICSGKSCIPWSFTTGVAKPLEIENLPTTIPTSSAPPIVPTSGSAFIPKTSPPVVSGTSAFCSKVEENIGKNAKDPANKQYDIDTNGTINGLDLIKCQQSGK